MKAPPKEAFKLTPVKDRRSIPRQNRALVGLNRPAKFDQIGPKPLKAPRRIGEDDEKR
jgi:hypothetical protein